MVPLLLCPVLLLLSLKAVLFAEGAEILSGSCTFENSTCSYKSTYTFIPWTVNSEGHYVSVDTSHGTSGQRAVLVSPDLQPDEWSCLKLVYQITGSESSSSPSKLNVFVQPDGDSFDYLLWTAEEQSDSWLISSIDLRNTSRRYKIIIEGILGADDVSSIAIFELKMTTGYCIECDFEENHLCGYMNSWNPNVNWFVGGGNIRNSHSILPKDHTLNSETGHYMYVDSVYVKEFQEVAQLVSPLILTPISGCLSFYYQIQQENNNDFMVFTRDLHGSYEEIWKMEGARQGEWNFAEVDLNALLPVEIIFEVAFNGVQAGYVALDDISFNPEYCNGQKEPDFNVQEAGCDFENDLCQFHQDNKDSGWHRVIVKPNAYRIGDHTTGMGYFMLANSRLTSHPGYVGRLYGPSMPGNTQYCLRFFYAFYGFSKMSDTLAVYLFEENLVVQEKIWSVRESTKGVWLQAEININKPMPSKVVFMSWCKSFWDCGIVALDDVSVHLGHCQTADRLPQPPGKCTFEKNDCGFRQEWQRRGMWHRFQGRTPTSYTGPNGDHTSGVGRYMYIEATHMVYGQKAKLLSRELRAIHGKQCLTFFYHMYGAGTGQLNVYLRKESARHKETLLWSRRGEQSISWLQAQVEYECDKQHQIIFEAVRGISIRSDIAVDDIMFQSGPCKDTGEYITLQSSGYSDDINEIEI
uniref:MAM domain containing 2 n=1 Tax=Leptobrachium leishanense TaxID=445787 RepID=A0A8C5Q185_9ANUR